MIVPRPRGLATHLELIPLILDRDLKHLNGELKMCVPSHAPPDSRLGRSRREA